jgi:type IV secretion system protein VirB4
VSEAGRRLYETALGPLALAFAGSTDPDSIATIKRLEARHGDGWMGEWLATKSLRLDDYLPMSPSAATVPNDYEVTP